MGNKIGIKFCGNCNPHINSGKILRSIKDILIKELPHAEFVSSGAPEISVLLVISGCPADCAGRPADRVPEVVIAGETVNRNPSTLEDIPAEITRIIRKLF